MSLTYSYKINSARVVSVDGLDDIVKEVEVSVVGTDGSARFELPVVVMLGDADPESFTPFPSLTEPQIIGWVENSPSLDGTKAHIAFVVAKEVEKLAMEQKPLPWSSGAENQTA